MANNHTYILHTKRETFLICIILTISLCFTITLLSTPIYGQTESANHETHLRETSEELPEKPFLGVTEKLGDEIPLDLFFFDEHNTPVSLAQIIDKPTLILPIYFHCPSTCPILLANLATALNDVVLTPGQDYQIIALSFDHEDTPAQALKAKNNYSTILREDFPQTSWTYLTGSKEAIKTLTNAMGFGFYQTAKHFFNHPSVLISLSASGKIIRYIYGPNFLPFDISMALAEAEKGTPSVSIKKLLTFCFSYDPAGKKYVFNTFKLVAISTLVILFLFYMLILRKGNKSGPNNE